MLRSHQRYLLESVFRSPDDPAAAPSADPGAAASGRVDAAPAAAAPPAAAAAPSPEAAPAADAAAAPAAETKPESTPSLLEAAQAKPPGDKPADKPQEAPAEKPADAAKPATEAKPDDSSKDAAKPAEKPADAKPDPAAKKDGAAPADAAPAEKPQARSYEAFTVPDGTKLDDKQVKGFTDVLEAADLGHQERAQKLIDMHVAEMQRVVNETTRHQRESWNAFTDKLKADYKADPELGGNRTETTLGQAKYLVEKYGGSPEQVADTLAMLTHSGMGNHVGLARVLNNMYEAFLAKPIVPGSPPSRNARRSFQDVAYGDGSGANGAS